MEPANEGMLIQLATEVLESMAFTSATPEAPARQQDEATVSAAVAFTGPFSGRVLLTAPQVMLPCLASNMLGLEPDELSTDQQQYDALGELANVMCGNLVQMLAGPEPVFTLASPEVHPDEAGVPRPMPQGETTSVRVPLEEGWVELTLVITRQAQAASV
jgi:CheY-specific phosphatase CheX